MDSPFLIILSTPWCFPPRSDTDRMAPTQALAQIRKVGPWLRLAMPCRKGIQMNSAMPDRSVAEPRNSLNCDSVMLVTASGEVGSSGTSCGKIKVAGSQKHPAKHHTSPSSPSTLVGETQELIVIHHGWCG